MKGLRVQLATKDQAVQELKLFGDAERKALHEQIEAKDAEIERLTKQYQELATAVMGGEEIDDHECNVSIAQDGERALECSGETLARIDKMAAQEKEIERLKDDIEWWKRAFDRLKIVNDELLKVIEGWKKLHADLKAAKETK